MKSQQIKVKDREEAEFAFDVIRWCQADATLKCRGNQLILKIVRQALLIGSVRFIRDISIGQKTDIVFHFGHL